MNLTHCAPVRADAATNTQRTPMKTLTTLLALVAGLTVLAGCKDDAADDPQTIRETGYLSCQDGADDCDGFRCEARNGDVECIPAPNDCAELTCACLGELACGDTDCFQEEGWLRCGQPAWDGCAGLDCGSDCHVCDPDDPDCNQPGTPTACNDRGECVTGDVLCEQPYDACLDKTCGDVCSPCDVNDPNCAIPDLDTRCDAQGDCVEAPVACDGEWDDCAGRECGDACSPCDPDDPNCAIPDVATYCDDEGNCRDSDISCNGEWEPCADKECGETCTLCDPNDPNCNETQVVKACNQDGACVSDNPVLCGEMICEGEQDLTCDEGEICCVDRCCGGEEQCCAGVPIPPGEGLCMPADNPCPISRRDKKKDIKYLSVEDTDRLGQQVREIQLTTYRYKNEPDTAPRHLGFIIDDEPGPHTVTADGGHVDLYGYTSLTVATLQVQSRKIELLEAELKALRNEVKALQRAR